MWQDGEMADLNALTVGSSLYLIGAADINSRGQIVGTGSVDQQGEPLAFLAVPCVMNGTSRIRVVRILLSSQSALTGRGSSSPGNLRERLLERVGFGTFRQR